MNNIVILAVGVLALAAVCCFMHHRISLLEADLEMALSVISSQTAVLGTHTKNFEALEGVPAKIDGLDTRFNEFKERFDDVMVEAEKQVQMEAKWNTGLNNILNYCLEDSFKAGGNG